MRGSDLVVTAVFEGREAAQGILRYLGLRAAPIVVRLFSGQDIEVRKRRVFDAGFGYAAAMELDSNACFRAVRAHDRRFDGRFFVGVTSTHIYCRPICPARPPEALQHAVLFERGGRGRRRIQALPALPAGTRAGPCIRRCRQPAGRRGDRRHRRARALQRQGRRTGGVVGGERPAPAPRDRIRTRRVADRTRPDAAVAVGKAPARRNQLEPDGDRLRQRLRQRAALQCTVQITLWFESAGAARHSGCRGGVALSIGISPAVRVAQLVGLSAAARHPGRRDGGCRRTIDARSSIDEHQGWIAVSLGKKTQRAERRDLALAGAGHRRGHSTGEAACSIWVPCPMR